MNSFNDLDLQFICYLYICIQFISEVFFFAQAYDLKSFKSCLSQNLLRAVTSSIPCFFVLTNELKVILILFTWKSNMQNKSNIRNSLVKRMLNAASKKFEMIGFLLFCFEDWRCNSYLKWFFVGSTSTSVLQYISAEFIQFKLSWTLS